MRLRWICVLAMMILSIGCRNGNDGRDLSDAECVSLDSLALEIAFAAGDSASSVTQNLGLASIGRNGTTISWSSDDTARVDSNGRVVRPKNSLGDISMSMNATIAKGNESTVKKFYLTVKKTDPQFVRFVVTVPVGTPPTPSVSMISAISSWTSVPCTKINATTYQVTVEKEDPGFVMNYKYARGSLSTIEKDENGNEIANRIYTFKESVETIDDAVSTWADWVP
jgi:hypothetical protein